MTPSGIQPEVDAIKAEQQKIAAAQTKANVPAAQQYTFTSVEAPSCSVAGESVDDGNSALCFGKYMRIHALGASSGLTYSQMGQYAAKPDAPVQSTDFNGGTSDPKYAQVDPKTQKPVSNGARNLKANSGSDLATMSSRRRRARLSSLDVVRPTRTGMRARSRHATS